ncbi:MAG: biotin--[acetyl-CoA-carboxylase] ligase, partial [Terriglobia bacterium]
APLIACFEQASSWARGKRVQVNDTRATFTGTTAGLDATGCLLVHRDSDGRTVPVLAADVTEA